MPRASEHVASSFTKLLYIGDSGTGKTTSLFSLVAAGYKLRIWDYDNLLSPLVAKVRREAPERLDAIEFVSLRDELKASANGPILNGTPKAFERGLRLLEKWEDDSDPDTWGADHVIVIDSFTSMCRAAYNWAKALQGGSLVAEGVPTKGYRPEATYHAAQQAIMNVVAMLNSPSCQTNVICIAHIKYMEKDNETKGFPVAVGNAISPEIPTYFPSVALATKRGLGDKIARYVQTTSTNLIDLKNPKSFEMLAQLPMESALADFFKTGAKQ